MSRIVRWSIYAAILSTVCAISLRAQPPAGPGGAPAEAAGPRMPGGALGHALGEYLTIEGTPLEQGKVEPGTLLVDTVNGKKLAKPVGILLRTYEAPPHRISIPYGKHCVLKGYETGSMIGTPPAVLAAAKEQGRKDVGEGQAAWQWHPYFVVLIAVEPKGLKI